MKAGLGGVNPKVRVDYEGLLLWPEGGGKEIETEREGKKEEEETTRMPSWTDGLERPREACASKRKTERIVWPCDTPTPLCAGDTWKAAPGVSRTKALLMVASPAFLSLIAGDWSLAFAAKRGTRVQRGKLELVASAATLDKVQR